MEPAATVIKKCGGLTATAALAGVNPSTVHRWRTPIKKKGTGGEIPHWNRKVLLEKAAKKGIDLKPEDFIPAAE